MKNLQATTQTTNFGNINIAKDVIASVAGAAAVECYGLIGMASRKLGEEVSQLLGRDQLSKGVEVNFDANVSGHIDIDLYIIVSYGVKISEVALNVMERVKYSVEEATGLVVDNVNVNIQGVKVLDGK